MYFASGFDVHSTVQIGNLIFSNIYAVFWTRKRTFESTLYYCVNLPLIRILWFVIDHEWYQLVWVLCLQGSFCCPYSSIHTDMHSVVKPARRRAFSKRLRASSALLGTLPQLKTLKTLMHGRFNIQKQYFLRQLMMMTFVNCNQSLTSNIATTNSGRIQPARLSSEQDQRACFSSTANLVQRRSTSLLNVDADIQNVTKDLFWINNSAA